MKSSRPRLLLLEANIDDMNPQWYGPLIDRLLEKGALDVILLPAIMKKSRPGVMIQVLTPAARRAPLIRLIFEETTTLGVRYFPVQRTVLRREIRQVQTPYGKIAVKVAHNQTGQVIQISPEHDSCLAAARRKSVPLKKVYQTAVSKLVR